MTYWTTCSNCNCTPCICTARTTWPSTVQVSTSTASWSCGALDHDFRAYPPIKADNRRVIFCGKCGTQRDLT